MQNAPGGASRCRALASRIGCGSAVAENRLYEEKGAFSAAGRRLSISLIKGVGQAGCVYNIDRLIMRLGAD